MRKENLDYIIKFIRDNSGIILSIDKTYLIESRLTPVAKSFSIDSIDELIENIKKNQSEKLIRSVIDAMTTNESFFFRDAKPFESLANIILPNILSERKNNNTIRIWCAAASTGQEPYSIAIIIDELESKLKGARVEIIATDICTQALKRAKEGIFTQFEVQRGLSAPRLVKNFEKTKEQWQVKSQIRNRVKFQQHNLLSGNQKLGKFDIIFLRNVLIYFDTNTKRKILEEAASMLSEGGALCLGGTETILGVTNSLDMDPLARGFYHKSVSNQKLKKVIG